MGIDAAGCPDLMGWRGEGGAQRSVLAGPRQLYHVKREPCNRGARVGFPFLAGLRIHAIAFSGRGACRVIGLS